MTPTQDEGKLVTALHSVIQGGQSDLVTGVQVAQVPSLHRAVLVVADRLTRGHSSR